jgi:hypothetical protein
VFLQMLALSYKLEVFSCRLLNWEMVKLEGQSNEIFYFHSFMDGLFLSPLLGIQTLFEVAFEFEFTIYGSPSAVNYSRES